LNDRQPVLSCIENRQNDRLIVRQNDRLIIRKNDRLIVRKNTLNCEVSRLTENSLETVASGLIRLSGEDRVRRNVDMKPYTTMRVGGTVSVFVEISGALELSAILRFLHGEGVPHAVIGNGSNLIVADEGYEGVLLHLSSGLSRVTVLPDGLEAEAGALLSGVSRVAWENSFAGLEFASGIPGSLGGAVAMNAGAYGREMKDVVVTTTCLDAKGETIVLKGLEHDFGYRHSRVQTEGLVAVSARLRLQQGDPDAIRAEMRELAGRRADKQPLHLPSSGSTFKRPVGYFSGKLIEDCGLKGLRVGGAQVSEKHAGFVVNTGGATAEDVVNLVGLIRETVRRETGVTLEPEVKLLKGDSLCSF